MNVWTLSKWDEDGRWVYASFSSEEDARASAEDDDEVACHEVHPTALRTEYRWRATEKYRPSRTGLREVGKVERYRVNELSEEFGKGLLPADWDWGAHAGFSAPRRKQARSALEEALEPYNERERDRLDYIARSTHTFVCPDHGSLGRPAPPTAHIPCIPCGRWVDSNGHRFGRYESGAGEKRGSIQFSFSSGDSPGHDEGPLPDHQRQIPLQHSNDS